MARARALTIAVSAALLAVPAAYGQSGAPDDADQRQVSWKQLPANLLSDQKKIWTFPAQVAHGRYWLPVLAVVGTTAALIATDAKTAGYFRGTPMYSGFNRVFNGNATMAGTLIAPIGLYVTGLARKDSYATHTALLAGEAVADAEVLTTVLKDIDKRSRPASFAPGANLNDSWFESSGNPLRGTGSFPSGHTIAAFSVATVVARRYGHHYRWVPYVAYGLAATVGFSRLTLSAHFLSDVFAGATFGYTIGRFSVLRQ
jgi:membrane-associated phospholipid phosphatase